MAEGRFDPRWLSLREEADHRARCEALLPPLVRAWKEEGWSRVLDLGCGTGSNLRYLAPRLPDPQEWILLDHDESLLDRIVPPDPAPRWSTIRGSLQDEGLGAIGDAHLVTGSALLDLVSAEWLAGLVEACRRAGCGALFALTYDGRVEWSGAIARRPAEVEADAFTLDAVNRHQRRDKGLGPALGPAAGREAARSFRDAGYRTWLCPSPWHLVSGERALAEALVAGWEQAAAEIHPEEGDRISRWARSRRDALRDGDVTLVVGHLDLLALPEE